MTLSVHIILIFNTMILFFNIIIIRKNALFINIVKSREWSIVYKYCYKNWLNKMTFFIDRAIFRGKGIVYQYR